MNSFTPTQQRIIDVLSDGQPHKRDELVACLDDELSSPHTIRMHLYNIRRILRERGQDIICEFDNKRPRWRHVILLLPVSTERLDS